MRAGFALRCAWCLRPTHPLLLLVQLITAEDSGDADFPYGHVLGGSNLHHIAPVISTHNGEISVSKFRKTMMVGSTMVALSILTPVAHAHMSAGDVSLSISGGANLAIGGTMHDGANAPVADLGALNPDLDGIPAILQIEDRSQNNVYDTGWNLGAELGYALSDSGEALLGVRYLKANGNRINVGGAAAGAPVNATLPVFGDFGDYEAVSIELGYRQYVGDTSGVKPFLSGRIGTTRISAIQANFTVPDAGIALNDVPFSKSSWVLSGALGVGVSLHLSEKVRLEPEVGLQYIDGAKGNDAALAGLGLGRINNKGDRLSVPINVRLKFTL